MNLSNKTVILVIGVVTLLAVSFFGYQNFSKEATIQIVEPGNYTIGELVILDASNSPGTLQWTILPETTNFKIVGKTAYFSSPQPVEYTVFIAATSGGTLATKIISLSPTNREEKVSSDEEKVSSDEVSSEEEKVSSEEEKDPLIPAPSPKYLAVDPEYQKVAQLIDGGVVTTLDDARSSIEQLNLKMPDNIKTLKGLREWLRVEHSSKK